RQQPARPGSDQPPLAARPPDDEQRPRAVPAARPLVAVKILTGDGSADSNRQVARFAREAAVAGGLAHPNIVTIHDFVTTMHDKQLYA
ncbi:hypothetical protein PV419_51475, partial [Streptomyces sp. ME19-01-6]|nr:hypothetical protein [Streptomyces sp. ME19-01-6]